jgi:hypothetical protein
MLSSHPIFYLKANNYLMESLLLLRHPEKFKSTLEQMRQTIDSEGFPVNTNTQALAFLYRVNNELNLHFLKGTFEEGLSLISEVKQGIKRFENQIDAHHVMMLYYKMACMYFGAGDYKQCIDYLRPIIFNSNLTMREDLMCFSRILDVIAHFEAGLDNDLDRLLLSTYRFLIRMNDLHQVQRLLIQFIRELGSVYPQDLKEKFRALHGQLLPLEEDYYERRSFLYLDVLSWLESHITSTPLAQVVALKNAMAIKASRL